MVFFTCDACGESLKKGQVEKHTAICRNCRCLSCIDCGKDFWGDDYKNHLKCISEDQKYGGKAYEAKANKGDVKQQQWIQKIHEAMKKQGITPNLKNILSQISTYDNIPRKKGKFQNWMKNSLKIDNKVLQEKVWEIFSEATSTPKEDTNKDAKKQPDSSVPEKILEPSDSAEESEKKKCKRERKEERQKKNRKEKKDLSVEEHIENNPKKKCNKHKMDDEGEENGEDRRHKKKKRKHRDEDEDGQENGQEQNEEPASRKRRKRNEPSEAEENSVENGEENSCNGKFNWKGTIKALLRQADDQELPIKKLRKKVLAQYYAVSSAQHKSEEDLFATFNKKIHNNPKFRILKERVKLIK